MMQLGDQIPMPMKKQEEQLDDVVLTHNRMPWTPKQYSFSFSKALKVNCDKIGAIFEQWISEACVYYF